MSPFCRTDLIALDGTSLDPTSWGLRRIAETEPCLCTPGAIGDRYELIGGLWSMTELGARIGCSVGRAAKLVHGWTSSLRLLPVNTPTTYMVPAFQIDVERGEPSPVVHSILTELCDCYSRPEITDWFLVRNVWIAGLMPAQVVGHDPRAALGAARADRFLAQRR